jgi:nucleotide-binding universal stress UspA family protein
MTGEHAMIIDILLTLTSFPVPTERRAIEAAVRLAEMHKASVSAIAFEMDIQSPIGLYTDPLHVRGILAADSHKSAANARELLDAFESIAAEVGVGRDRILLKAKPVEIPQRLVDEARFHDIAIVALKDTDGPGQEAAEQLIFESGRPVLLLPNSGERELSPMLDSVAIAWDFSRPATRAVADAMPFIRRARQVRIVTVVDDKAFKTASTATDLARYLARHGVTATLDEIKGGGHAIGDVLRSYVGERGIDLLVMGGYGHSRMREFILGGATKNVLLDPPTWTLISH